MGQIGSEICHFRKMCAKAKKSFKKRMLKQYLMFEIIINPIIITLILIQ